MEMDRLDKEAEEILENDGPESPLLMDLYEVRYLVLLWPFNTCFVVSFPLHTLQTPTASHQQFKLTNTTQHARALNNS